VTGKTVREQRVPSATGRLRRPPGGETGWALKLSISGFTTSDHP
jgi:hypothetical protein